MQVETLQARVPPSKPILVQVSASGTPASHSSAPSTTPSPQTAATGAQTRFEGLPPVQLYDLETDIRESNNVQGQHPEIVAHLRGLLEKYRVTGRST